MSNNNNRSWRLHCHRPSHPSARITSNEGWIPCQITACGDDRVELINRLPFPHPPHSIFLHLFLANIHNYSKIKGCKVVPVFISTFSSDVH